MSNVSALQNSNRYIMEGVGSTLGGTSPSVVRLPFQVFVAKYNYDPVQYSPNDNPEAELTLTAGDYLFIYGEIDEVHKLLNITAIAVENTRMCALACVCDCVHLFVYVCMYVCICLCMCICIWLFVVALKNITSML